MVEIDNCLCCGGKKLSYSEKGVVVCNGCFPFASFSCKHDGKHSLDYTKI